MELMTTANFPNFMDSYVKPQKNIMISTEEPFITTTDKDTKILETPEEFKGSLVENVSVKTIKNVKRKRNVMEMDLTFSDMLSKEIKLEYPVQKTPQISYDEIAPEIYLAKKTVGGKWTDEETDLLFKGISAFGTDFSMISCIFLPNKTRNQIKSKYKLEEKKKNPGMMSSFEKKNNLETEEFIKKKITEMENEQNSEMEKEIQFKKLFAV